MKGAESRLGSSRPHPCTPACCGGRQAQLAHRRPVRTTALTLPWPVRYSRHSGRSWDPSSAVIMGHHRTQPSLVHSLTLKLSASQDKARRTAESLGLGLVPTFLVAVLAAVRSQLAISPGWTQNTPFLTPLVKTPTMKTAVAAAHQHLLWAGSLRMFHWL